MIASPAMRRMQNSWKVLLFLLLTVLFGPYIVGTVALSIFRTQTRPFPPDFLLLIEAGQFAIVLLVTLVLARMERTPFGAYGLPLQEAFKANFWIGLLLGLAEGSVVIGAILILGGYSFGPLALHGAAILQWGLLHLVLFLFVGLYEEFVFRGYAQFTLAKVVGFWPAAILLSVGFGLIHLANRGEGWVGALSVAIVGLLFSFALKRSGNLWYAVGLHAGFDWAESFLYSVPDSGEMVRGHLSNAILHGPKWLTGGSIGPEGSVFCFITLGLQFLVVNWLFPARDARRSSEARPAPPPTNPLPDTDPYQDG
jgi:uncharacterized protein